MSSCFKYFIFHQVIKLPNSYCNLAGLSALQNDDLYSMMRVSVFFKYTVQKLFLAYFCSKPEVFLFCIFICHAAWDADISSDCNCVTGIVTETVSFLVILNESQL